MKQLSECMVDKNRKSKSMNLFVSLFCVDRQVDIKYP